MSPRGRSTPVHPALVRPVLLGGAEREPALVNAVLVAALVLGVGPHPLSLLLAGVLATLGHAGLVLAACHDPQMWRVYTRHVRYQPYYPARALHGASAVPVHPFRLGAQ